MQCRQLAHECQGIGQILRTAGATLAESLEQLEISRQLNERLLPLFPGDLSYSVEIGNTWYRLGQTRRLLEQHDESLAAYRQAVQAWQIPFDREPGVPENRKRLSSGYSRLHHWLRLRGCLAEAANCLLEQKKLWPGNAEMLRGISRDYGELAAAVGGGRKDLTPSEQLERQRYLEMRENVKREAAEAQADPGRAKPIPNF